MIIGISDQNTECRKQGYKNWIGFLLLKRGMGHTRPDWEHPKGKVLAAVSKSRWYVKCPDPSCGGRIGINENEPLHFCPDCLNVENDFKPQVIVFKNTKDVKLLLGKRKDYRRRNFIPHLGEKVSDLEKENKKHGWDK